MSEDEGDGRRRSEIDDPLEEQTQPMAGRSPEAAEDRSNDAAGADLDTTTWSGGQAPPVLIEEQETVIAAPDELVPEPEPEPEPEPASEPESEPELMADTVVEVVGEDLLIEESTEEVEQADAAETPTVVATNTMTSTSPSTSPSASESIPKATIAPSSSLHPMLLERVEPSLGRGERVRLDAAHWRVSLGRADHNDLRLYTASASREHAVIAGNDSGEWVLTPSDGKTVSIDGDPTAEAVILEVGMNIVMGADHLRCVTEGLDRAQMSAQTSADAFENDRKGIRERLAGLGPSWWLIGGVAVVGLGLIAFAWFGG